MKRARDVLLAASAVALGCGRSGLPATLNVRAADPTLVRACVRLLSCESLPVDSFFSGYESVSQCIWDNQGGPAAVAGGVQIQLFTVASVACLSGAADCGGADACVHGGGGPSSACSAMDFCEGSSSVYCVHGTTPLAADCTLGSPFLDDPGGSCFVDDQGYAQCGAGACAAPPASACNGDRYTACKNGVQHEVTCPDGTTCGAGGCSGTGAACSADRCDGDDVVTCVGGAEWRYACGAMRVPGTCGLDARGRAHCIPSPALSCDPLAHADRCDGTRVVYCDGRERTFDCRSAGFASCMASGALAACTG